MLGNGLSVLYHLLKVLMDFDQTCTSIRIISKN